MHGFTSANYLLSDFSNTEKQHCTKGQFKKTFHAMADPYSVDPHFKFIFSTINKSHLKDEYDDAILDLTIAFEVALLHYYSLLVIAFENPKKENLTEEFIKKLHKKVEEFEETSRIKERIKEFEKLKKEFDEKLGKNFIKIKEAEEYSRWYEIVWKRRHKVAHIGFEGTTKEEVKRGLSLTQKIISYTKIESEDMKKFQEKNNKSPVSV